MIRTSRCFTKSVCSSRLTIFDEFDYNATAMAILLVKSWAFVLKTASQTKKVLGPAIAAAIKRIQNLLDFDGLSSMHETQYAEIASVL